MKLVEISKKEFDEYAKNQEQTTFQQSSRWGLFKSGENWHPYYIGFKDKQNLIAASLLLSKENTATKKRFFYAPRGFLIDYKNLTLLEEFTKQTVEFVKEKNGVMLKIDPYVLYQERDQEGAIIPGGINNDFVEKNIREVGFLHVGDDFKRNMIQPRWIYRISLEKKKIEDLLHDMSPKARQIIRRNERIGFTIRELKQEEFSIFSDLMENISKKYNTLKYRLPYYEDLFQAFGKEHMKIMIAEFDIDLILKNLEQEIKDLEEKKQERIKNYHHTHMTEEVFIDHQLQDNKRKQDLLDNIVSFNALKEQGKKTKIILGGYLFLAYGSEVVSLQGAMEEEWMKLDASYSIHYEMLQWALENHYRYYNLYELSGNFDEKDPMYGSYQFKKNFGGQVVELLGEFDYPIDPKKYSLAKSIFPEYYGVKIIYKNNRK